MYAYSNHLLHYLFLCILVLSVLELIRLPIVTSCLDGAHVYHFLQFYIPLLNFRTSTLRDHCCSAWATIFN